MRGTSDMTGPEPDETEDDDNSSGGGLILEPPPGYETPDEH